MKKCTACQQQQNEVEYQETCGDMVFDYFVCRTCREKATQHTISYSAEYINAHAEKLGIKPTQRG